MDTWYMVVLDTWCVLVLSILTFLSTGESNNTGLRQYQYQILNKELLAKNDKIYNGDKEQLKWTQDIHNIKSDALLLKTRIKRTLQNFHQLRSEAFEQDYFNRQAKIKENTAGYLHRLAEIKKDGYLNKQTKINEVVYQYAINHPKMCENIEEEFLLILVRSRYNHFSQRSVIRRTWASQTQFQNMKVNTVFILGYPTDNKYQKSIIVENTIHGDIVQVDLLDTYSNSAYLLHSLLNWAEDVCMNAVAYLVTEDNVVVDLYKLIPYLNTKFESNDLSSRFSVCNPLVCCTGASDDDDDRTAEETEHFEAELTPVFDNFVKKSNNKSVQFCSSDGYAFSAGLLKILHKIAAEDILPFTPKELWLSELVRKAKGQLTNTSEMFSVVRNNSDLLNQFSPEMYSKNDLIFTKVGADFPDSDTVLIMQHLWTAIQNHQKQMTGRLSLVRRSDSDEIMYFIISFMLIDVMVLLVICIIIFMKKRKRKHVLKTKYYISYD